jgi:hypothetical protein
MNTPMTPAERHKRGRAVLAVGRRQALADQHRRVRVNKAAKASISEHRVEDRLRRVPLTAFELDRRRVALVANR